MEDDSSALSACDHAVIAFGSKLLFYIHIALIRLVYVVKQLPIPKEAVGSFARNTY